MTEQEIEQTQARTPPARRRRQTKAQTSIMLDPAERDALDRIADEEGKSRSELIRAAVRKVWLRKSKTH